jgi:hypothetical protein
LEREQYWACTEIRGCDTGSTGVEESHMYQGHQNSHTPFGVGKMMDSSMGQPASFLQSPFFTKVHASSKPLVYAVLSSTELPEIHSKHKEGIHYCLHPSGNRKLP